MKFSVLRMTGHGWFRLKPNETTTVWFRGYVKGRSPATIAEQAAELLADSVSYWLDQLDGHFSIVVVSGAFCFAASDPVRSFPLLWGQLNDSILISSDGPALEDALGLDVADIDPEMAHAVALSGYTMGDATLYKAVRQIGPGHLIWSDNEKVQEGRYHVWQPWTAIDTSSDDISNELSILNEYVIDDLVKSSAGRQILVPLSAGLDSRFIASGLREAGYENVLCVAYGLAGNRETKISRDIAKALGYDWTCVPYTNARLAPIFRSEDYARYRAYSDSLTGVHFPQEYPMLKALFEKHKIDSETIVVNGQSGDFIAGNHIPSVLPTSYQDDAVRLRTIIDALIAKHYRAWSSLRSDDRLKEIAALLLKEILALNVWPVPAAVEHGIYEAIEFWNRQSKYVINGQRTYEYFDLEWRLPLWSRGYLDFWQRVPVSEKRGQTLYKAVLSDHNWGGVWRNIPVNPTRIRPRWILPLRAIVKVLSAPMGRSYWHKLEKQYFQYWTGTTCSYAAWPYATVARDKRGHHNAISWHIEEYLNTKGLAWDGTPLDAQH
jgi:asparagine synthase (glutamine-hydrolysing)